MIFARKGTCLICGCKVTIARYESLAKVLQRVSEMSRCPQCGNEMAWRKTEVPELFKPKRKGSSDEEEGTVLQVPNHRRA